MQTVVKDTYFFINMELGHHFPVINLVYSLEYTHTSSEQSLLEYCTTLHKEHLLFSERCWRRESASHPTL